MKFSKFFSNLQEAPWYREFLNPVLEEIRPNSILLDIGTGSGKMLEILSFEKKVKCIGTDTNEDMLAEAKKKLVRTDVELHLTKPGELHLFEKNTFDYVTICSVLFHMKKEDIDLMLLDSLRVLKEGGKIIILTPTGKGTALKIARHYFSSKNKGAFVWHKATKKRAIKWTQEEYLSQYTNKNNLNYTHTKVMHDLAQLEVLSKK